MAAKNSLFQRKTAKKLEPQTTGSRRSISHFQAVVPVESQWCQLNNNLICPHSMCQLSFSVRGRPTRRPTFSLTSYLRITALSPEISRNSKIFRALHFRRRRLRRGLGAAQVFLTSTLCYSRATASFISHYKRKETKSKKKYCSVSRVQFEKRKVALYYIVVVISVTRVLCIRQFLLFSYRLSSVRSSHGSFSHPSR